MRKIESFSLFKMTSEDRFGFSPVEYSKFKYGSKRIALKFGYALADQFILKFSSLFGTSQIVVIPSAFSHVQTASCLMESFFVDRLNSYLFDNELSPVEQAKIYRTVSYREDYGEMSAEDRFNLIRQIYFTLISHF